MEVGVKPLKDANADDKLILSTKFIPLLNIYEEAEKFFSNFFYNWMCYMSENLIRFFFTQLLSAMDYLRKMSFLHRDIKLDNLLLMKNFQLKLSDFALSTAVPSGGDFKLSNSGTRIYMGSECFSGVKSVFTKDAYKLDYYSLAMILHKMLLNDFVIKPNENKHIDYQELIKKLESLRVQKDAYFNCYSTNKSSMNIKIKHFMARLLDKEIAKRADLSEDQRQHWKTKYEELIKYIYETYIEDIPKFLLEIQKRNLHYLDTIGKFFLYDNKKDSICQIEIRSIKIINAKKRNNINNIPKFKKIFRAKNVN